LRVSPSSPSHNVCEHPLFTGVCRPNPEEVFFFYMVLKRQNRFSLTSPPFFFKVLALPTAEFPPLGKGKFSWQVPQTSFPFVPINIFFLRAPPRLRNPQRTIPFYALSIWPGRRAFFFGKSSGTAPFFCSDPTYAAQFGGLTLPPFLSFLETTAFASFKVFPFPWSCPVASWPSFFFFVFFLLTTSPPLDSFPVA